MRLGIALEGGGARCAAQAGALSAFAEAGIRPDLYAGCGAGALVAALAASDLLIEETAMDFTRALHYNAMLRNTLLNRLLRAQFGGMAMRDIRSLAVPAVDMESGAVQVLSSMLPVRPDPRPWSRQSLVSTAIRASMATPGVLPPVTWRGRRLAGGGGLRGTLPTILQAMGADHIVCIRVLDAGCAQFEKHPAALALCAHALIAAPPPRCDIMITISGYTQDKGVLDVRTAHMLYASGKVAGRKAVHQLEMLTGNRNGKILLFPGPEEWR